VHAELVRGSELEFSGIRVSEEGGGVWYLEGGPAGCPPRSTKERSRPGSGPRPHTHPYVEFAVVSGRSSELCGR
jgi:hypothetical protein